MMERSSIIKLENKVLLPQTDCLQFAAEGKIYRLEYFTTVEMVEGGGYRIKDGSTSVVVRAVLSMMEKIPICSWSLRS